MILFGFYKNEILNNAKCLLGACRCTFWKTMSYDIFKLY